MRLANSMLLRLLGSSEKRGPISVLMCIPALDDCLGAIACVKFLINSVEVVMHGGETDPKLGGHLLVKKSFLHQVHHVILASR